MIGYEVSVNGKNLSVGVENGVLTLIITNVNTEASGTLNLDLTALDKSANKHIFWPGSALKEGDEIVVKIKNIEKISKPLTEKVIDVEEKRNSDRKNFYAMKAKLEKEGVI